MRLAVERQLNEAQPFLSNYELVAPRSNNRREIIHAEYIGSDRSMITYRMVKRIVDNNQFSMYAEYEYCTRVPCVQYTRPGTGRRSTSTRSRARNYRIPAVDAAGSASRYICDMD